MLGVEASFAGATPTSLPSTWQRRLATEAKRLGSLFQNLGYFGRCSFDAIVVGDGDSDWQLHWVECNGRWGGVSIPMTLANRLVGNWRRRPFVIADQSELHGPRRELQSFLDDMRHELFIPGECSCGLVILSPGRLEAGTGFELMVLGETIEAARDEMARITAAL